MLPLLSSLGPLALALASATPAPAEPPKILVTRQLAEAQHLQIGDVVSISGDPSGRDPKPFKIAGIYEPTPDPMRLVAKRYEARLHLPDLMALNADPKDPLSAESVTAVNVKLRDPADAEAFGRELAARVPGILALPTARADDGAGPFAVLERFHLAIALVTVLGSTAFLLALMVMRAEERRESARREISSKSNRSAATRRTSSRRCSLTRRWAGEGSATLSTLWMATTTRLTADWTISRGPAAGAATALATSIHAMKALPICPAPPAGGFGLAFDVPRRATG